MPANYQGSCLNIQAAVFTPPFADMFPSLPRNASSNQGAMPSRLMPEVLALRMRPSETPVRRTNNAKLSPEYVEQFKQQLCHKVDALVEKIHAEGDLSSAQVLSRQPESVTRSPLPQPAVATDADTDSRREWSAACRQILCCGWRVVKENP